MRLELHELKDEAKPIVKDGKALLPSKKDGKQGAGGRGLPVFQDIVNWEESSGPQPQQYSDSMAGVDEDRPHGSYVVKMKNLLEKRSKSTGEERSSSVASRSRTARISLRRCETRHKSA